MNTKEKLSVIKQMSNLKIQSNESISKLVWGSGKVYFKEKRYDIDSVLERKVNFMQAEPVGSLMCWFSIVIHLH